MPDCRNAEIECLCAMSAILQYRVVAVESDRLLIRGILSGEVLTIIIPEAETPLTHEGYPPALTDPSTAPLNLGLSIPADRKRFGGFRCGHEGTGIVFRTEQF